MPLLKNVCRCCLVDGCQKDISSIYYHYGQREVYCDMLMDTYNIMISYQDTGGSSKESRLICESCIYKLREAASFKQLVLRSELAIAARAVSVEYEETKSVIKKEEEETIDEEFNEKLSNSDFCEDFNVKDDFEDDGNGNSDYLPLAITKQNSKDNENKEIKKRKPRRAVTGEDHKHNEETNGLHKIGSVKNGKNKLIDSKEMVVKKRTRLANKLKNSAEDEMKESSRSKKKNNLKYQNEIKRRDNTIQLLENSNMILFRSLKVKFQCYFCQETFLEMKKLREHYATHDPKQKLTKLRRSFGIKCVDISNLQCKMCSHNEFESTEILQRHLSEEHGVAFEKDAGNFLVPYRLEKDFKCVICNEHFNTYMSLSVHMHKHYPNQICDVCGTSFLSKHYLSIHVQSNHKAKKCTQCDMVFSSNYHRTEHYVKFHKTRRVRKRYCLICDKTFKYTHQLLRHRVEEHGAVKVTAECQECGKTFCSQNNLKIHVRSVHLNERRYQCTHCTMRFFTKTDQKRHERSHVIDEKDLIPCSYCDTKFKSKDSWRRHLRRQHSKTPVTCK